MKSSGGGILGKLFMAVFGLLALAYAAKQIYEWLVPLVPSLMMIAGLILLFFFLARAWSSARR